MRHVSRTHRVALDWLFDRVKLDPKIQIKYIDTKNQFADMFTKSNFTRDGWNHLLRLFNIMNFSMYVEESSGKKDRRRACGGEIKASEFDIKKFERESISDVASRSIIQPGELQIGWEF